MTLIARWIVGLVAMFAAAAAACAQGADLVFAVNEGVTYRITPHETRERYRELAELIGRTLRRTVRVEPVENYKVLAAGLAERRYELAYIHPAHHSLRAIRDQQYQIVALTRGWIDYKARFLVPKDAKLAKPIDLRGAAMVMPDPDSITAWMARATLRDLGMDPAKEKLGTTRYQDAIPFMMENGFYQVGITAANAVVRQWVSSGGRILLESKPVPIKHVIASPVIARADVERLRALLLDLDKNERGKAILQTIGWAGFEAANEPALAEATRWLGL